MLALCLMLSEMYYAQNYAGIIGLGLFTIMQFLTYSITYSWGNKESLSIPFIWLCMHGPLLLLLLILHMQNNKSFKTLFMCDVQKIQGFCVKYRTWFTLHCICHPTPSLVLYFPYITHNNFNIYMYNNCRGLMIQQEIFITQ